MSKIPYVSSVMFTEEQVQEKVTQLAGEINQHFAGQKIVVVGILKGSFIFMADLVRKLNVEHICDFMALSSYGASTTSSGNVKILMDLRQDIVGAHILIVEDIVDSGLTLHSLLAMLEARGAASVTTCVFLRKKERMKIEVPVQFLGFDIPDEWVVGYGLDVGEKFRTLPYVGIVSFREE
eukprot:TRINITY_DN3530_c0_g1_i2.p1 TRINITY_DN3530_c0_g1~~TRINITY_DN3530_c0_g1_i2.p1  ORF type:complete len:201 (-),score=81.59 TRINITY_DN3530_c0_g1_i2:263-802(-)